MSAIQNIFFVGQKTQQRLWNTNKGSKSSNSLWLLLLFISIKSQAQYNLVPNHSFENYITCPTSLLTATPPPPWYIPTGINYQCCTYFNACSNSNFPCTGVPFNCLGFISYQPSLSGQAYEIIGCFDLSSLFNQRRYLQTQLKYSLKVGKSYYAEFYVSLTNPSAYACNNVSMLFTKTAQYVDTIINPYGLINANAQIVNYGNPIIKDTMNWVKVSGIFKAQGGEQFITIGNFKDDNHTDTVTVNFSSSIAYGSGFYLDDVSVIPLDSFCLNADAGRDTTIKPNDSVFIGSYTNGIDTIKWYNAAGQVIDSVQPGFWVKPTTTTTYYLQQMVNGCFTKDTVTVTVKPLPLQFISFSISPSFGGVRGGWSTANEVNVSHHNILRSINAKDFEKVGTVKALNNSYNEYSFIDELKPNTQYPTPLYYRIESIDKDGRKQYSAIKTVTINHSSLNVNIYPNPAKDVVNIYCKEGIREVKLFNIIGQQIATGTNLRNDVNGSTAYNLHLTAYIKGVYFFKVETKSGNVFNEKLIVE